MAVKLTQEMINGALEAQQKYGVPASVTLAQIIQESGGKYEGGLSGLAYNYNNLFGVKSGSSWNGASVALPTTEYKNGSAYKTTANFRIYNSIAESIDDHGRLLNTTTYTTKTAGAKNLDEYVKAMGGVYATDPNYANSLLKIIKDNNLTQYDDGSLPSGNTSTSSNSSGGLFKWKAVLSNIVRILAIILLIALAVLFFTQAFNIEMPTLKKGAS